MARSICGPNGLRQLLHRVTAIPETVPEYSSTLEPSESTTDTQSIGKYSSATHAEYMRLARRRWRDLVDAIRHSESGDVQHLKTLARLAYDVRRSASFRAYLQHVVHHSDFNLWEVIKKLGKISRFYRCSVTFVGAAVEAGKASTDFRMALVPSCIRTIQVLSGVTVNRLCSRVPLLSTRLDRRASQAKLFLRRRLHYIVHAEMLLLLFYEEHSNIRRAENYIGLSKQSCFLCDNFIRIHGTFSTQGGHQQLYGHCLNRCIL